MRKLGLLFLLPLFVLPARADDAAQAAAQAFYKVYGTEHLRGGGVPDATGRAHYAPVLSPRLNQQMAAAAAAEVRFAAKVKGAAPPLIEGDIFSSVFEGATAWQVGACTVTGAVARCPVALTLAAPGQKPANWHDTLVLANAGGGWKVDDVVYDGGFAFGNTGKLSDILKMVLAQASP